MTSDASGKLITIGATVKLDAAVKADGKRWVNGRNRPLQPPPLLDGADGVVFAVVAAGQPYENQPKVPVRVPRSDPNQPARFRTIDEHHAWENGVAKIRVKIVDAAGEHLIWARAMEVTVVSEGTPPLAQPAD